MYRWLVEAKRVRAGLNFMVWVVGSCCVFFFERKWVKKVAVGTGQCLLWWWWFVFESMVFGDVGFWVCDSEEWLITVRECDVFVLRKGRYEFNTIVGVAGDEDGFDFVLLDVKKQYRFFSVFDIENRTESNWNRSVGTRFGSVLVYFF